MIREEPEILIDIRDFTTQFYVILRRKFSEWLQWSIESALGMRFAIWSLDLPFAILLPSNTVSNVRIGHYKEYLTLLYKHQCFIRISATEKIHIFSHVKLR